MRLCSIGSCSDAIVMRAPNAAVAGPETPAGGRQQGAAGAQLAGFDRLVSGMVCEAIDRLGRTVTTVSASVPSTGKKAGWPNIEVTAAQKALWAKINGELSWPWDMQETRLYEQL